METATMNPPASSSRSVLPAAFAIFGKHPAWADHMEDLGLATPALAAFKRQFYVDGLGGCVARSVWSEDLPGGAPPPYDHGLLTVAAEGWIAARFVHSLDAGGRGQYPLVACLQGTDDEELGASAAIWPWLETQLAAAREAARPELLRQVFAQARDQGPTRT